MIDIVVCELRKGHLADDISVKMGTLLEAIGHSHFARQSL